MKKFKRDQKLKLIRKTIGDNLKKLRKDEGKTLIAVSRKVRISSRTLSLIEKGRYNIRIYQLFKLGKYYKVRPSRLLLKK